MAVLPSEVLERISDAFVALDAEWHSTYVNQRAGELLGKDPQSLIGVHIWTVFPEGIGRPFRQALEQAKHKQVLVTMEEYYEPWDRWFEFRIHPSPDGLSIFFTEITERKKLQERLQEQHADLQLLLESAPDVIARYDRDLRHVYVSRAIERSGLPPEAFLGKTHVEVAAEYQIPEPFASRFTRVLRDVRDSGQERTLRFTFGDSDAPQVWESRISPLRDREGNVQGLLGVGREITDRVEAQQALRASEERFRTLVQATSQIVWRTDGTDGGLAGNDSWIRFTDQSPEQAEGWGWLDAIHPEDRAPTVDERQRSILEKRIFEWEHRVRREDGEYRDMEVRAVPMLNADGSIREWVGTHTDITERTQAEAALRKSEARFRQLIEQAPEAIFVHDTVGRFVDVNPRACESVGYTREELLAMKVQDFELSFDGSVWNQVLAGAPVTTEGVHRMKDGSTFPVEIRIGRFDVDEQPLILAFVRDISERVRLEEQLRQASKMEAVGQLAGGVAHDFNNMLQAIGGFAAFLEGEVADGSEAAEYVSEIQKASSRAAELTRQLLAFGRRQVLRPELLEINGVVQDTSRMLQRLIPESIEIETRLDPRAGQVRVDPTQMHQVLLNLALNARDAMPEGGRLVIRTARQSVGQRHRLRYPSLPEGEYVKLVVQDTGTGMDEQTLLHAFEPFFTRKVQGQGTGLGLSTVDGIVRQSGGHIWAESTPGQGSVFTILLPQQEEDQEAAQARGGGGASSSEALQPGRGTVLLAEDEEAVRRLARLTLEKAGYRVLEAGDGDEALRLFQAHGSGIDLLLSDVVMPRMGGKALADALRASRPALPIILMSGYAGDALPAQGTLPPGTTFLHKPFSPQSLTRTVAAVLRERHRTASGP